MIYIVSPVYNEEKNIPRLAERLREYHFDDQVFFVFSDDGSTDGTVQAVTNSFPGENKVILGDGVNRGPGYAFNEAFNWVLADSKNNDDMIVSMEADCTSDLSILSDMIAINRLGYGLVLASVYAQGGGFDETTLLKRIVSWSANVLFRLFFNVKVQTLSSFYRVYSISAMKQIKKKYSHLIEEMGFICMLEILLKAIDVGIRIIEVPMELHSHERIGNSKMKVLKTALQYGKFLISFKSRRSPQSR